MGSVLYKQWARRKRSRRVSEFTIPVEKWDDRRDVSSATVAPGRQSGNHPADDFVCSNRGFYAARNLRGPQGSAAFAEQ